MLQYYGNIRTKKSPLRNVKIWRKARAEFDYRFDKNSDDVPKKGKKPDFKHSSRFQTFFKTASAGSEFFKWINPYYQLYSPQTLWIISIIHRSTLFPNFRILLVINKNNALICTPMCFFSGCIDASQSSWMCYNSLSSSQNLSIRFKTIPTLQCPLKKPQVNPRVLCIIISSNYNFPRKVKSALNPFFDFFGSICLYAFFP